MALVTELPQATAHDTKPEIDTLIALARSLTIRHYRWSDAAVLAYYCNNKKLWINQFDVWPRPYTLDSSYSWINITKDRTQFLPIGPDVDDPKAPRVNGRYVIALNDEAIGTIGFKHKPGDILRRQLDVGYWIGEEHWGHGYATECLKAVVAWCWETFGWCVRIEAVVFGWNESYSGRVLLKAGFEKVGRLRAASFKDGKLTDAVIYESVREGIAGLLENDIR